MVQAAGILCGFLSWNSLQGVCGPEQTVPGVLTTFSGEEILTFQKASLCHDYNPADQKQNMMFHDKTQKYHILTAAVRPPNFLQANLLSGNLVLRFPHFLYLCTRVLY